MADNTTLNANTTTGDAVVTREISHAGDTAKLQGVFVMGISGSEGAYTAAAINGDATNGLAVDVTRLPALAAGTNNIGDVDVLTLPALPAGTNNIGDVDVLSVVPGTSATSLGKAEDAAHASGDTGVMALAVRQDANTSLVGADGDYAPLQVDATGNLKVAIISGAGSGGTSAADGATFTRNTTSLTPAGAAVESSAPTLTNGDVAALSQDTSGNLRVRVAAGGIAGATHDSAAASEGVQGILEGRSSEPTAVTSGDAVRTLATLLGKQVVVPYAIPGSTWSYASPAAVTDTADDAALAAAGAGVRAYITGVQVFNGHDTVGTEVVIKDGSTVLWRGWAEQTGGGCSARFDPPLRGTANTAVNVANITTGSSTYFNLQGYTAAE